MEKRDNFFHEWWSVLLCLVSVLLLLFGTVPLSEAVFMPDTGQILCYDVVSNAVRNCANTGQDGEYSISPMWLLPGGTDTNTGLIWQVGENPDNTITDCSDTEGGYNWYEATGTYDVAYNPSSFNVCVNKLGSPWRLPTKKELMTLVNYGIVPDNANPPVLMIDQTIFPHAVGGDYWSSSSIPSSYPVNSGYGWFVNFSKGEVYSKQKHVSACVRCVYGMQLSFGNLVPTPPVVIDVGSGLMWQQGEPGSPNGSSWAAALAGCNSLSLGGFDDWRLPNIKELETITDDTRTSQPLVNLTAFPSASSSDYWSSTTDTDSPGSAWIMATGWADGVTTGSKGQAGPFSPWYRCVRDTGTGSYEKINVAKSGTGTGTAGSSPPGLQAEAPYYPPGTQVTLVATPGTDGSIFKGWSGDADCADGEVTMDNTVNCTAQFTPCAVHPVRLYKLVVVDPTPSYTTIANAYSGLATGSPTSLFNDIIKVTATSRPENLNFNGGKNFYLYGGFDCPIDTINMTRLPHGMTTIIGSMTIASGTVVISDITIQ